MDCRLLILLLSKEEVLRSMIRMGFSEVCVPCSEGQITCDPLCMTLI